MRIPKEIVLTPESAVAEFAADPRASSREEPDLQVVLAGGAGVSLISGIDNILSIWAEGAGGKLPRRVAGEPGCHGYRGPAKSGALSPVSGTD